MSIEQQIQAWRALSPVQQLELTLKALPQHIAMSMAMEGEPVPMHLILQQFDRLMVQRALSRLASETYATSSLRRI